MRKIILLIAIICYATSATAQKKVSVLGDSYSTYEGFMTPSCNLSWYAGEDGKGKRNDVSRVEETWWHLLIKKQGWTLEANNSYSGATICFTGYRGEDYSDRSFITRMYNLGNPDIILIFGGTNDSWARSPIGINKYSDWTRTDLFQFRQAFCYLLSSMRKLYPQARIINITNNQLKQDITTATEEICNHYGVINIQLRDIDKQHGHPSVKGMKEIAQQIEEALQERPK